MKKFSRIVALFCALMMLVSACGGDAGSIEIEEARYRLSRPDLGAGYLSITNTTGADVTLQAATAAGIGRIELHESLLADDGTMAMVARPEGFLIADGATVSLQPGGLHLMLFDPVGTDDLTLNLDFGDQEVTVTAVYDAEASAAAMSGDGSMADMGQGDMDQGDMDHGDMDDDAMDHSDVADDS